MEPRKTRWLAVGQGATDCGVSFLPLCCIRSSSDLPSMVIASALWNPQKIYKNSFFELRKIDSKHLKTSCSDPPYCQTSPSPMQLWSLVCQMLRFFPFKLQWFSKFLRTYVCHVFAPLWMCVMCHLRSHPYTSTRHSELPDEATETSFNAQPHQETGSIRSISRRRSSGSSNLR